MQLYRTIIKRYRLMKLIFLEKKCFLFSVFKILVSIQFLQASCFAPLSYNTIIQQLFSTKLNAYLRFKWDISLLLMYLLPSFNIPFSRHRTRVDETMLDELFSEAGELFDAFHNPPPRKSSSGSRVNQIVLGTKFIFYFTHTVHCELYQMIFSKKREIEKKNQLSSQPRPIPPRGRNSSDAGYAISFPLSGLLWQPFTLQQWPVTTPSHHGVSKLSCGAT